jgi:hypothetical protein
MLRRNILLLAGFVLFLCAPFESFAQFPESKNLSKPITSSLTMTHNQAFHGGALREATVKQRKKTTVIRRRTKPTVAVRRSGGYFRPILNSGVDRELASSLTQNPGEQQALLTIFREVKKSYDVEAAKLGQSNNVAGALTFFIATCVTAFNDAPEPSDAATENLLEVINELALATPELSRAPDREKQIMHERLIYVSGLILAGYLNGKQTNDADSTMQFRLIAGSALQSVLNVDPQKLRFDQVGLVVDP